MTDVPRKRGRPRKVRPEPPIAPVDGVPTNRLRHKPGVGIQQAWQHAAGLEWRPLPVVAADAADWEDS